MKHYVLAYEINNNSYCRYVDRTELELRTRGQGDSDDWMAERRSRLTASNFHRVVSLKSTTGTRNIVHSMRYGSFSTAHTRFGIANEEVARKLFSAVYGKTVRISGLVVDADHPFLAASPGKM